MEVSEDQKLVSDILQNNFVWVQQKKEIHVWNNSRVSKILLCVVYPSDTHKLYMFI